jgi:hypothetical protein
MSTVLRNGTSNYVTDYCTPRSIFLLEKLISPQLSRNSPQFIQREGSLPHTRAPSNCQSLSYCKIIPNILNWVVSTSPNRQAGEPSLVGSPWLLTQCIHTHPPYPEAVLPSDTWRGAMLWWQWHTYDTNPTNNKETITHHTTIENEIITATSVI